MTDEDIRLIGNTLKERLPYINAVLVGGSRVIVDSCWETLGEDYDVVVVLSLLFARPLTLKKLRETALVLTDSLSRKVDVNPLFIPNLNLRGNLFLWKLTSQSRIAHGNARILSYLKHAVSSEIAWHWHIVYILSVVRKLLAGVIGTRGKHSTRGLVRDGVEVAVAIGETMLLRNREHYQLPQSWRAILEQASCIADDGVRPVIELSMSLVESCFETELDLHAFAGDVLSAAYNTVLSFGGGSDRIMRALIRPRPYAPLKNFEYEAKKGCFQPGLLPHIVSPYTKSSLVFARLFLMLDSIVKSGLRPSEDAFGEMCRDFNYACSVLSLISVL